MHKKKNQKKKIKKKKIKKKKKNHIFAYNSIKNAYRALIF